MLKISFSRLMGLLSLIIFFDLPGEANRLYWRGRQHRQMGAGLQRETLRHTGQT